MTGKHKAMAVAVLALTVTAAFAGSARAAGDEAIVIGQWRTETTKSLVCGGEELNTIVAIAKRANAFYSSGAKQGSPEYEAYWSYLEKARGADADNAEKALPWEACGRFA